MKTKSTRNHSSVVLVFFVLTPEIYTTWGNSEIIITTTMFKLPSAVCECLLECITYIVHRTPKHILIIFSNSVSQYE